MNPVPAVSSGTTRMAATLAVFVSALESEGVPWSLLRPRESLGLAQGDVDILVEPAQLRRVRGILASLGFVEMHPPGRDLHAAAYDEACGRFVWIHVQSALQIAGATISATEVLAATTAERPPQPQDAWLLWILLLRALVDKGELPERHRAHVAALARRWEGGPEVLEAVAGRHGLQPAEIVALAAARRWDALIARSVHHPPGPAPWSQRLAHMPLRLRGITRGRGLSVAILGPDGAGKTTLIEGLTRSLPLPSHLERMGLTGGRLRKVDALRVPGVIFVARVGILWLRYLRAVLYRTRGRIVLFDRYPLDGAVPSGTPLSRAGRLSRRLQQHVCPLPDVVILLDASGATMHGRKGEYDPDVLEAWRHAYARLQTRIAVLQVIDAEQPADDVRREAEALIWRRYAETRRTAPSGRRR